MEQSGPVRGNAGLRAQDGRGAPGSPGTPDSTGARASETGAAGLPRRLPRRPESSDTAVYDGVILSDHDLAVIRKALPVKLL
jgi:hypothetical protein